MGCKSIFFYGCLKLRFPDVSSNHSTGKVSSVLAVSSWSLKFLVSGWIVICLLSIVALVRTTECLIIFVKLWGASNRSILNLFFLLWVISTVTTQSGWGHASLMPMVRLLLTTSTVADCSQLVNGPTHRAGGVLDLVLTNIPDLCDVHVHGNVGRLDHVSLGVTLNLLFTVAGFDVARRVLIKSRINWNAVCKALSGFNWRSIFRSSTMVQDFDMEVSRIMEWFIPMVTVRKRGRDAAWFDGDCRRAFQLKQSAYHRWCRNSQARGAANRLYAVAKARYYAYCRLNLDDCASAIAWWRRLNGHVFGADSDVPPSLCSPCGAFISEQVGKRLSSWVSGLIVNNHETLLSCRRQYVGDQPVELWLLIL